MSDSWSDHQHSASRVAGEVLKRYPISEGQPLLPGVSVRLNLPDGRVVEKSYEGDRIEIGIGIDEIIGDGIHYPSGIAFMASVLTVCEELNVACNYENLREVGKGIEEALGIR